MKWKNLKRAVFLTLAISTGIMGSNTVFASSIMDEITSEETTEAFSKDITYSLLRGNNLNYGSTEVSKQASNKAGIYGNTQCHKVCSTVYLDISLERKVDGVYSTYKSWEFTANNVTHLSKSLDVLVPSGYYYRVRGYHAASNGGTKESASTLTQGVLIS